MRKTRKENMQTRYHSACIYIYIQLYQMESKWFIVFGEIVNSL